MQTLELPVKQSELTIAGEKINKGLVIFEERKDKLTSLAVKAALIIINGIDDKAGITAASIMRKELKSERVLIQNEGKGLRDTLTVISREISAKEKELIAITSPEENRIADMEAVIEAEKETIKQAAIAAENTRVQTRIDSLAAYGFAVDFATVKTIDDATFAGVLENAKAEHLKELAAKAEAQRLIDLEAEKLKAERLELEELRAQQAAAQLVIKENNDRLQKEITDKAELVRLEAKKVADEKQAIENQKKVDESEKVRWAEFDRLKAAAFEEARLKAISDAEIEATNKAKELAAAKLEDERQAGLRPDKEKLQLFSDSLSTLKIPVVTNADAQLIVNDVQLLLNKIQAHIIKKIKSL